MKPKPIEYAAYAVVGSGCGVLAAIVIGLTTQLALRDSEQRLDRFNAVFWALTVPTLTVACGIATGSTHLIIAALRRSMLQSEVSEPVQPQSQQAFTSIAQTALFPESDESAAPVADMRSLQREQARSQFETLYSAPEPRPFVPENSPKSNHPLDL